MFSRNKPFSTFDGPQKPFCFVRVNSVLNVFAVGKQFKIIQPVIGAIQIFMVNFHTFWDRANERLPHRAVNGNFSVIPIFAWAKPDIMVARYVRFNWTRPAITRPCLAVLDVKRGCNASVKKVSYSVQRSAAGKHGFGLINLRGAKKFSSCYATNARKIADFVQAFIATNRFPNLHAVNIKPIHVGGQ